MKHKLLQTWARKSAKLLAAVALLATTSFASMAADYTIFPSTNLSDWAGADKDTGGVTSGKGGYSSTYTDPTDNVQFKITLGDANDSQKPTDTQIKILQNHTTTISSETVDMTKIVMTNTTGNARDFTLNFGWSQSNSDDGKTITFTNTNGAKYFSAKLSKGRQIVVSGIVVTSASAAPSTDLGEIMYGDGTAHGQKVTAYAGDVFTFTADNADSMSIKVGTEDTPSITSDTNSISWTAETPVEDNTTYNLTISATKGTKTKTATFTVVVKIAPRCGNVIFTPGAGEITKGSYVTITCANATQIKYWFESNPTYTGTVPVADAKVKIDENCTLHAVGINADGVEGIKSTAEYTVVVPVVDELTITNFGSWGDKSYQWGTYEPATGAKYWYKVANNSGMQINSTAGVNKAGNLSGIALIDAPEIKVIDHVVITFSKSAGDKQIVKFSNTKATIVDGQAAMKDNTLTVPADNDVDDYSSKGIADGLIYTFTPDSDYKYFTLTSSGAIYVDKVEVFFKKEIIIPDAPALHSDVETDSEGVITGSTLKFEDVSEGLSIWWRIVPEVTETPADGMVKEEVEFQKYTEPVTLSAGTKGTLQYYAQHDATGGKSEIQTVKVNVPDSSVGIAGIEAEDGEAVYFNLQGVRVQNPENGIFIRVQNGKATKIMK